MHERFRRVLRSLRNEGEPTRIHRGGMPNGFLFRNLIWFGDGRSRQAAVSRGFLVEPGELELMDERSAEDQADRLRMMLRSMGKDCSVQVRFTVGGDYSDVLGKYKAETDAIVNRWKHRWQIWNRTERCTRYTDAMNAGKLRRETLVIFFTRVIDSQPMFSLSESALEKYFDELAEREANSFAKIQGDLLNTHFPDCRVRPMTDADHFAHYYRFLNPSVGAVLPSTAWEGFDPYLSLQSNFMFDDLVQLPITGTSFSHGGYHHSMLVMSELPKVIGPATITHLLGLHFQDYELTMICYPRDTRPVIKDIKEAANQLEGEAARHPKERFVIRKQVEMVPASSRQDLLGIIASANSPGFSAHTYAGLEARTARNS
jgi:type IV secretion system protein TrbE